MKNNIKKAVISILCFSVMASMTALPTFAEETTTSVTETTTTSTTEQPQEWTTIDATVIGIIGDKTILVSYLNQSPEYVTYSYISSSVKLNSDIKLGDVVKVTYDGVRIATYPSYIENNHLQSVEIKDSNSIGDILQGRVKSISKLEGSKEYLAKTYVIEDNDGKEYTVNIENGANPRIAENDNVYVMYNQENMTADNVVTGNCISKYLNVGSALNLGYSLNERDVELHYRSALGKPDKVYAFKNTDTAKEIDSIINGIIDENNTNIDETQAIDGGFTGCYLRLTNSSGSIVNINFNQYQDNENQIYYSMDMYNGNIDYQDVTVKSSWRIDEETFTNLQNLFLQGKAYTEFDVTQDGYFNINDIVAMSKEIINGNTKYDTVMLLKSCKKMMNI